MTAGLRLWQQPDPQRQTSMVAHDGTVGRREVRCIVIVTTDTRHDTTEAQQHAGGGGCGPKGCGAGMRRAETGTRSESDRPRSGVREYWRVRFAEESASAPPTGPPCPPAPASLFEFRCSWRCATERAANHAAAVTRRGTGVTSPWRRGGLRPPRQTYYSCKGVTSMTYGWMQMAAALLMASQMTSGVGGTPALLVIDLQRCFCRVRRLLLRLAVGMHSTGARLWLGRGIVARPRPPPPGLPHCSAPQVRRAAASRPMQGATCPRCRAHAASWRT